MFGPPPYSEFEQNFIDIFYTGHTHSKAVGDVATEAGVDSLVLHHFVPADIPAFYYYVPAAEDFAGRIVVGRDGAKICVNRQ